MNEVKLALANQVLDQRQLGQWLKSWQVGQVLQARVLETAPSGRMLLGVAGRQLVATTEVAVPRGTALALQVYSVFPLPSLKIMNLPLHSPVLPNLQQQRLQHLLPRQGSITAPLLTLLDPAQKVNILSVLGVKTDALARLEKGFSHLGLLTELKGLQTAVASSGLFLEADLLHQLNQSGAASPTDLKATLLKILQQLQGVASRMPGGVLPAPQETLLASLRGQLEGALAVITLNQLAVTQAEARPAGIWLFDMPFLVRNALRDLHLTIERRDEEDSSDELQSQEWRALVRVVLPRLGPLEAELFLRGRRASVAVYAMLPESVALLESHMALLQDNIERCGLEVSVLACHLGPRQVEDLDTHWHSCVDLTI